MTEIVLTEAEFRVLLDGGTVKKGGLVLGADPSTGEDYSVEIRLWAPVWGAYSETKPREKGGGNK